MEILKTRGKVRYIKINLVFYNGNGNRIDPSDLARSFCLAVKKAGIGKLRCPEAWQRKSITMVMQYAHHYAESLRNGVGTLDRVQGGISTF